MLEHKIKKKETTYQGRAFSIEKVSIQLPDGRDALYDLVQHTGSVCIIPVDEEDNILFVHQYRLGAEQVLRELPAGTLSPDEEPLHCAQREIREETGMRADEWTNLGDLYLAPGYSSEHMTIFLATGLHEDPMEGDEDEFLEVEKIQAKKVFEMVKKNQVNDGKSLAALLLALPKLRKIIPALEL